MERIRLLRITTVPISLQYLLRGQLSFMQKHGMEVMAVSAEGPEVQIITEAGIPHAIIPFTRAITPVRDFLCLLKLIQLIRIFKPQIVHSHTPKAGLIGMLAAWWCSVPVRLHTVAGLPLMEATGIKRWVLQLTEKATYFCSTEIYVNSKSLVSFIQSEFKAQNLKLKTIGNGSSNGIDLEYFSVTQDLELAATDVRCQLSIQSGEFLFCFVGRMVRDKGMVELIQAFLKICESGKKVRLLLVGHFEDSLDPLPKHIHEVIDTHNNIFKAGFKSDVRPWILASDALVLPSYREGFPNVLLQAGALEKPSIATNINGCNEIILDGKTGWLVPTKDPEALQQAMESVMCDEKWCKEAGRYARNFVADNFDQSYVWNEILKEYRYHLSHVS
ncbi:MAG: glycosyltransferase family 4 protein [Cyclobacteriaceae bacterium]